MPLSIAKTGQKVRVFAITAEQELRARLIALGIIPGEEIEVVLNSAPGSFVVAVKGSRVMLGEELASQIQVV
ncbi:MAG: ferrous iron transport protein A [Acidobacteriota bacterium]|jgi:Fe2+ transport system protein FeoA|nr:ferrous iron transport protein A [Acidobacteriota bacterium]